MFPWLLLTHLNYEPHVQATSAPDTAADVAAGWAEFKAAQSFKISRDCGSDHFLQKSG
jgi:hypothetical protein